MATAKENSSPFAPALKPKASFSSERHGRLKLGSSSERLLPSLSPHSPANKGTGFSVRGTVPKSFIKSLASLARQEETVGRAQIDHLPAFTRIFEKRSSTVAKAPTLHTEKRALVRSKSPPKMASQKSTGTNTNGNGGTSPPHRNDRQLSPRSEMAAREMGRFVSQRNLHPHTQPLTDREGSQPNGYCNPPSSPISDTAEERPRDSLSPEPHDHHPQRDDLTRRRKDDDDQSGGGFNGTKFTGSGYYGGKGYSGSQNNKTAKTSASTRSTGTQTTITGSSRKVAFGLNGSAAWFIPQNGRYEQLLPREQLVHTANWHKEEGKIPCGFSQRAKFHQGGYRCNRA